MVSTRDVRNQGHMEQVSHSSSLVHSQQLLHSARWECAISNIQYSINMKEKREVGLIQTSSTIMEQVE